MMIYETVRTLLVFPEWILKGILIMILNYKIMNKQWIDRKLSKSTRLKLTASSRLRLISGELIQPWVVIRPIWHPWIPIRSGRPCANRIPGLGNLKGSGAAIVLVWGSALTWLASISFFYWFRKVLCFTICTFKKNLVQNMLLPQVWHIFMRLVEPFTFSNIGARIQYIIAKCSREHASLSLFLKFLLLFC